MQRYSFKVDLTFKAENLKNADQLLLECLGIEFMKTVDKRFDGRMELSCLGEEEQCEKV